VQVLAEQNEVTDRAPPLTAFNLADIALRLAQEASQFPLRQFPFQPLQPQELPHG
jgi:hypothetical protein